MEIIYTEHTGKKKKTGFKSNIQFVKVVNLYNYWS